MELKGTSRKGRELPQKERDLSPTSHERLIHWIQVQLTEVARADERKRVGGTQGFIRERSDTQTQEDLKYERRHNENLPDGIAPSSSRVAYILPIIE